MGRCSGVLSRGGVNRWPPFNYHPQGLDPLTLSCPKPLNY